MSRLSALREYEASLRRDAGVLLQKETWDSTDVCISLYLIEKLNELPDTYDIVRLLDQHLMTANDTRRDAGHVVSKSGAQCNASSGRKALLALFSA